MENVYNQLGWERDCIYMQQAEYISINEEDIFTRVSVVLHKYGDNH
jgi:hypothetical protein